MFKPAVRNVLRFMIRIATRRRNKKHPTASITTATIDSPRSFVLLNWMVVVIVVVMVVVVVVVVVVVIVVVRVVVTVVVAGQLDF